MRYYEAKQYFKLDGTLMTARYLLSKLYRCKQTEKNKDMSDRIIRLIGRVYG
jgi:hypothetical protein